MLLLPVFSLKALIEYTVGVKKQHPWGGYANGVFLSLPAFMLSYVALIFIRLFIG